MEALGNLVVATADLLEAEGRTLRKTMVKFFVALSLVVAASLLGLLGFGFLLYGLFALLARIISVPAAAAIFGVAALAIAGLFSWIAKDLTT